MAMAGPRSLRALLLAGLLATTTATACSSDGSEGATAPGEDAAPTTEPAPLPDGLEGPITGGTYDLPYLAMPEGWEDEYGYTEEEFFLSGEATSYEVVDPDTGEPADALGADGRWESVEGDTADFATRLVVRRPRDAADFNGVVVVEWLNVSAGRDSDPDFGFLADELLPGGFAYVGVSAQRTGVEPGGLGIEIPDVDPAALAPLKDWDPERYGELSHPGDDWSYDIFTQAAEVVTEPGGPLADLAVEDTIAVGESQSAFRLVSYVNAVHQHEAPFDGYLVHSRGDGSALVDEDAGVEAPSEVAVRDDQGVPVLIFETETDLGFLQFGLARQDDSEDVVTWEVAGTGHADRSTLDYGVLAGQRWTDATVDLSTNCGRVNEGPQQPVVQAAFAALVDWVVDGTSPPTSPRIELDEAGEVVRDDLGIAQGGIRTPDVDAPVAVHSGENPSTDIICVLFGSTEPLTDDQLADLYADHDDYVAQVTASAEQAVAEGHLLQRHADAMIAQAESSDIGE